MPSNYRWRYFLVDKLPDTVYSTPIAARTTRNTAAAVQDTVKPPDTGENKAATGIERENGRTEMGQFNTTRWIDFGDFGQHEAEVSGRTGDFGQVTSVRVTYKGETLELVRMLPQAYEDLILEEAEIDERSYYRDMAEDARVSEAVERMGA